MWPLTPCQWKRSTPFHFPQMHPDFQIQLGSVKSRLNNIDVINICYLIVDLDPLSCPLRGLKSHSWRKENWIMREIKRAHFYSTGILSIEQLCIYWETWLYRISVIILFKVSEQLLMTTVVPDFPDALCILYIMIIKMCLQRAVLWCFLFVYILNVNRI